MTEDARVADTAADALLGRLAEWGVDYVFANSGTDFPPIIEGLAKAAATATPVPEALAVPHENLAVAMAHGHTMVSGRAQAVMVHVNAGTANAICALTNAAREQVPMLLCAGRTPWTEHGVQGSRSRLIHWAQEMFDQGGMVREIVKWDYELRLPDQMTAVVDRAMSVALTRPRGPVYLTLPREPLSARVDAASRPAARPAPARPPAPAAADVERVAALVAAAEFPLVITASVGRVADDAAHLAALAERFALPVVCLGPRYVCLPSDHPMHLGSDPGPYLDRADVILVIECDVPWIPSLQSPSPDCRIVHIGADPLFARYPLRGFAGEIALTAACGHALPLLSEALEPHGAAMADRADARRAHVAGEREAADARREAERHDAEGRTPIDPVWLARCLDQAKTDDAIVINELGVPIEHLTLTRPGTYFGSSPAGGLGWGLGAALGAKLAAPDRLVIAVVGDGSYMFGNPTPAHYMSQAHDLPVLVVVKNNSGWAATRNETRRAYPDGRAMAANSVPLTDLAPSPAFEKVVEASGGHGERVDDPAALPAALDRALRAVRDDKRQALLNVICRAP